MFVNLLILIVSTVSADLIGYNRNVNNNYLLKTRRVQEQRKNLDQLKNYRLGQEGHYRASLALYMIQKGQANSAKKILNDVRRTGPVKSKDQKSRRMAYNRFMRRRV